MPTNANQYYCDVMTLGPGMILMAARFRVDGTSSPDRTVDECPNLASTVVVYEDTGKSFAVTLPKVGGGWPQEMVSCVTGIATVDATDAAIDEINQAKYVVDSYNPATGTFTIIGTTSAAGDPIGTAPTALNDNSEVHFVCMLRKDKILGQTV